MTEEPGATTQNRLAAPLSEDEIISQTADMLYKAVSLFEDEDEALSDIVQKVVRLSRYRIDDPYTDDDDDREEDLIEVLRNIRDDIKHGDTEHALLLIHYETGDW